MGESAFHATALTTSGALAYVGGNWTRDVAFAGYAVPLAGDFPAQKMLDSVPGVDPARKERLIKVLDINPEWRMHMVSDGQRRRVQIAVGLLRPFKVLLLDEITVDLDVLGRAELMKFLKEECVSRGAVSSLTRMCHVNYDVLVFETLGERPADMWFRYYFFLSNITRTPTGLLDPIP
jgi:CCR4-NOT complex subunit CAF16